MYNDDDSLHAFSFILPQSEDGTLFLSTLG